MLELKLQFFAGNNEADSPIYQGNDVPTTNTNNSEIANRNGWVLIRRAKYDRQSVEKAGNINQFFMPEFFTKLETNDNPEVDSTDRAQTRTKSNVIIAYDSHVKFEFRHYTLGHFAEEIMPIVENRWVGNKANVECLVIDDIQGKYWDETLERWNGTGFKVTRYFGPLVFDNSYFSGDDNKISHIKAKVKPKTDPVKFDLMDGNDLDELIKDFALLNHPMDTGNWSNATAGRYK